VTVATPDVASLVDEARSIVPRLIALAAGIPGNAFVNAAANARCAGIGSNDGDPPTTTPLAAGITVGSLNSATFETTLPAIPCRAAL